MVTKPSKPARGAAITAQDDSMAPPQKRVRPAEVAVSAKAPRKRAPGGGLKAKDGVGETERFNVMLDAHTREILQRIGGDKNGLSLGVREAARRLEESGDTAAFDQARHDARNSKSTSPK